MPLKDGHSARFDYSNKRFLQIKELAARPVKAVEKDCLLTMLRHLLTFLAVALAVAVAYFYNMPAPPLSPILDQWKSMGNITTFEGHQVFYFDVSTPQNVDTTLVYIHGFPTSSFDIYKLYPHLYRNVGRIVALDLIGFGFSDKPSKFEYSIQKHTDQVVELITSLELSNVHVLTHDYGDSIGQELLARQREGGLAFTIGSMCMLNGGLFPSLYQALPIQKVLRTPLIGTLVASMSNIFLFELNMKKIVNADYQYSIAEIGDLWALICMQGGYHLWPRMLAYLDERVAYEERWTEAIRHSPVPLHFIYGSQDPINPPPFADLYKQVVTNPSIDVFDDLGHYPQIEDALKVLDAYLHFLRRNNFL